MTNEEKIREIFPKTIFVQHKESEKLKTLVCSDEWLNAEYQEPTTKNDLGVDAVSRKEVMEQCQEWRNLEFVKMTNPYYYLEKRLNNLSSVTIRPKGHWIWCVGSHKCSNCEEYTCFSDKKLLRYCPNCGAEMEKEVEE